MLKHITINAKFHNKMYMSWFLIQCFLVILLSDNSEKSGF